MPADADAAVAAAHELITGSDEAEETPNSPEAAAAEETQPEAEQEAQPEAEAEFELDPEVPEDLAELLAEPDFEAEAEAEVSPESEEEFEYEDDSEKVELKKQLVKAQKEADHYKKLRLTQDRTKWETEAKKYAPLSEPFLARIAADSRRSFMRQAKDYHDAIKPLVEERIVKPLKTALELERQRVTSEAREEAAQAWGKPSAGPGTVPIESSERQAKMEQADKGRDLIAAIKLLGTEGGEETQ